MLVEVFQATGYIHELHHELVLPNTRCDVPTRVNGFWFGVALRNFMISPSSIQADTMEKDNGIEVTPTNGRMFSCRSHFHPTTSFAKRWECSVSISRDCAENYATDLVDVVKILHGCGLESLRYHRLSLVYRLVHVRKPAARKRSFIDVIEPLREHKRGRQNTRCAA